MQGCRRYACNLMGRSWSLEASPKRQPGRRVRRRHFVAGDPTYRRLLEAGDGARKRQGDCVLCGDARLVR
jgi:hypothetical protein